MIFINCIFFSLFCLVVLILEISSVCGEMNDYTVLILIISCAVIEN